MKIVYWSFSILPSQTANSVSVMKMAAAFSGLGHDVVVLARNTCEYIESDDLFENYGVEKNFKIIRVPYPQFKFGWVIWGLRSLKIVRKIKPNLVFSRDSFGSFLSALCGLKVFFEVHSAPFGRDKFIFRLIFKLKYVKKVIAISNALRVYLLKNYSIKKNKIIVAHDGVDQSWLNISVDDVGTRKELCYNIDDFIIGYSGSLYEGRGIELILGLARKLHSIKFLIIGGSDKERKKFSAQSRSLGLNNLQFIGYIANSKLPKYLFSCNILLMPYQRNLKTANNGPNTSKFMSPLKMFEYMATGKPIISSNLDVLKEILVNEKNALLVEPDNLSQWCNAIEKLKLDSNLAYNLGINARDNVRNFTWAERSKVILNHWLNYK